MKGQDMDNKTDLPILLRIDPWIFRLEDLTLFEKCLLNFVYSFSILNKCCFSPDEWLAHKFGFEPSDVKTTLDLLQMKGYIAISRKFDGGHRSLSFNFSDVQDPCTGVNGPEDAYKIV